MPYSESKNKSKNEKFKNNLAKNRNYLRINVLIMVNRACGSKSAHIADTTANWNTSEKEGKAAAANSLRGARGGFKLRG